MRRVRGHDLIQLFLRLGQLVLGQIQIGLRHLGIVRNRPGQAFDAAQRGGCAGFVAIGQQTAAEFGRQDIAQMRRQRVQRAQRGTGVDHGCCRNRVQRQDRPQGQRAVALHVRWQHLRGANVAELHDVGHLQQDTAGSVQGRVQLQRARGFGAETEMQVKTAKLFSRAGVQCIKLAV